MNIGELAELTGLARSRIRFYESKGLLSQVGRGENGYRRYSPEAAMVLKIITSAQQAGFSLAEIAKVLPSDLGHWEHGELLAMLRRKMADIDDVIAQMTASKQNLEALIARIENKPEDMACEENARRIFAEIKDSEA